MSGPAPGKRPSRGPFRKPPAAADDPTAVLLSQGLIVDGTGAKAYTGSLLIRDGKIARLGPGPIRWDGVTVDCAGRAVCPGFIDVHSHLDWHLPLRGRDELKCPFIEQGVTTVVAGHDGLCAAGFREASLHRDRIEDNMYRAGSVKPSWDTVEEYLAFLAPQGLSHNLALLSGHGSVRMSLRGLDPCPLHPYESLEMLRLLETAMDQGAKGVSLGLPYQPGMHATAEEMVSIARLVRKKDKVLAVHPRALSALSAAYPRRLLGVPHNLIALREVLDLARKTGVRLQVTPFLFAGSRTGKTRHRALRMIDEALRQGTDVAFDTVPFLCGASCINAVLPPWFLARGPEAYKDRRLAARAAKELGFLRGFLGSASADLQVTDARDPDLKRYDGMLLSQIARLRHVRPEQAALDLAQRSGGMARVLWRGADDESTLDALIRHPASLFSTGAWVESSGIQNPNAFGAFPRFLRLAREHPSLCVEEAVRKMTSAAAGRFHIEGRGVLRQGAPADVVVFDPQRVTDRETEDGRPAPPEGIEYVFVNGRKALSGGRREGPLSGGSAV